MEIISKIAARVSARAALDESGNLNVTVSAVAVYDPKKGSVTTARCEMPEENQAEIKAALERGIEACREQIQEKVMDAITISRQVGQRLGEVSK